MKRESITDECGNRHYFAGDTYRGWRIGYGPDAPVTGRYKALRHGVAMCAGTRELLLHMIDTTPTR